MKLEYLSRVPVQSECTLTLLLSTIDCVSFYKAVSSYKAAVDVNEKKKKGVTASYLSHKAFDWALWN